MLLVSINYVINNLLKVTSNSCFVSGISTGIDIIIMTIYQRLYQIIIGLENEK